MNENDGVTRRDFLNGVALTVGAALTPQAWASALEAETVLERVPGYYPPALTGLRGSHEGAYEAAHKLRDQAFWETAGAVAETGETYDLVVVGGGISGLSAAHFYRKAAGAGARVLVLDNHDDFGGHAKRNEFTIGGRLRIGYGGSFAIESPAPYSKVARDLISELGVDIPRLAPAFDRNQYRKLGLRGGVFFDRETFGADRLLPAPAADPDSETGEPVDKAHKDPWPAFLAAAPLSEAARRDIQRLVGGPPDPFPGQSSAEKKAKLARISYARFITETLGLHADVLAFFQARPHTLYGVGIDGVSAQDAWGLGMPGFAKLGLDPAPGPGMGRDAIRSPEAENYFFHFPDGNATLARLLVRRLVPRAIPGKDVNDVVLARADYARLDEADSPARIRLNSTVVRVRHTGEAATPDSQVEVTYMRGGQLHSLRAKACILACWHTMIPHICPDLPAVQREALAYEVKVPIVYTNVLLRDWKAFQKLGVSSIHCPGSYHTSVNLDLPVSLGGYQCARKPEEPIVVHMVRTPCNPGMAARDQHQVGRMELLNTSFETFETRIREQLGRILGPGGFDARRDIAAITVNRWPHGYAYQYNSLFDSFWLEGTETPCQRARRPFGRIAIANADADAYAYNDAAIDQAHRAVGEILALRA